MKLNTGCGVIRSLQSVAPLSLRAGSRNEMSDPIQEMESYAGLYTYFGDHWCWIYKEKGQELYTAIIEGLGHTTQTSSLEDLKKLVKKEYYLKETF